jgi:Sec-independent protein translocase protein TatA
VLFNLGLGEIAAILVLGLLIFGPDRLPKAVQTVVGGLRRFRSAADDATRSLSDAAGWDTTETRQTLTQLADLHPRRLASSVLDEPTSDTRRPANDGRPKQQTGNRPARSSSADGQVRPAVDFDPDAP